jgi:hypothetical protein
MRVRGRLRRPRRFGRLSRSANVRLGRGLLRNGGRKDVVMNSVDTMRRAAGEIDFPPETPAGAGSPSTVGTRRTTTSVHLSRADLLALVGAPGDATVELVRQRGEDEHEPIMIVSWRTTTSGTGPKPTL